METGNSKQLEIHVDRIQTAMRRFVKEMAKAYSLDDTKLQQAASRKFVLQQAGYVFETLLDAIRERGEHHKTWSDDCVAAIKQLQERAVALEERLVEVEAKGLAYCGIYQKAQTYSRGSVVTHAGGLWVALRTIGPTERPGDGDGWQLAVKPGRDGRDAGR